MPEVESTCTNIPYGYTLDPDSMKWLLHFIEVDKHAELSPSQQAQQSTDAVQKPLA